MAGLLIIDDDPVSAALLRHLLQRSGYPCRVAGDAASAWQLLSPEVSLVLLDIQMPGDNGPEILRRMRLDPTLADIPVIFVTARTDPATRIHCLAMGAAGFVTKPIAREDVLDQVRAALARSQDDDPDDDVDPLEAALDQEGSGSPGEAAAAGEAPAGVSVELLRDLLAERRAMRRALASHRRLVSALFRLHQAMRDGASPQALAGTVVALARRALRARAAELWTRDGDAVCALTTPGGEAGRAEPGGSPPAPARFREPAVRRAFADWLTVTAESDAAGEIDVHFPLAVGAERVGVLSMRFAGDGLPSESLTGFFCAEVALALDSASRLHRSQREAVADPLTGLYNRRYFEGRLGVEIERARACGEALSLLFVDVDRFKWVNDTLGHDMGDRLLRLVASRISGTVRGVDVVCRYGGDEMVVILPETDRRGCRVAASRLQGAVAESASDALPDDVRLTVTVGGATYPDDGETAAELVASADAAMLRGKRAGRARIELFAAGGEPAVATASQAAPNAEDPPRGDPLGGIARNTRMTGQLLRSLIGALHVRDPGTADHSRAVSGLSARLARHLGASAEEVHLAGQVGLLHDVGKLHTPSSILLKPGPLDAEERAIMNLHAEKGAELVESVDGIRHLAAAVRASQEHFDGSGYPDGLAGDAIPLVARIVAVADAYHAMTSDRVYRAAMSSAEAEAELQRCAGTQFDPVVVEAMVELARRETRH